MTEMPELNDCSLTIDRRVAVLELERDDVRNALTGTALGKEIPKVMRWLNSANEVSVVVITGSGGSFSAGGNVKHMRDRQDFFGGTPYEIQDAYRRGIQQIALAMYELEIPSIAAVNGAAIGAGLDLALMCDVRVASEAALFGETFVTLGIIPGDGGAWFLPRTVGYQRAVELALSGRRFDAAEAHDLGIVLEVTRADTLRERAVELAQSFAENPPQAIRLAKRLLRASERLPLNDFLDLSAALQTVCHSSADHLEAVTAFLDKRPPVFRGN